MLRTFNVERTAQAAGIILQHVDGNRMPYIRLLKLLYLADRASIQERGFPITGDDAYAMKHGPVLSRTYDLLKGHTISPELAEQMSVWKQWIRTVGDYDVELAGDPGFRKLSRYEIGKLNEIVNHHAEHGDWELVDKLHRELPEWRQTYRNDGSSHLIATEMLLEAVGQGDHSDAINADAAAHQAFAPTSA